MLGAAPRAADSRELAQFGAFTATVPDEFACGAMADVQVTANEEKAFPLNRKELEDTVRTAATLLWLECPELTDISVKGQAGGKNVFSGKSGAATGWELEESGAEAKKAEEENKTDSVPVSAKEQEQTASAPPSKEPEYKNEAELRAAAVTSEKARVLLAKLLAGLIPQPPFPITPDAVEGMSLLKALLGKKNPAAAEATADLYAREPGITPDYGLVRKATGKYISASRENARNDAINALYGFSAARGEESALKKLASRAEKGKPGGMYQLGMLYALDRGDKLTPAAGIYRSGSDEERAKLKQMSNVAAGKYFLEKAARQGDKNAQALLAEMTAPPAAPPAQAASGANAGGIGEQKGGGGGQRNPAAKANTPPPPAARLPAVTAHPSGNWDKNDIHRKAYIPPDALE